MAIWAPKFSVIERCIPLVQVCTSVDVWGKDEGGVWPKQTPHRAAWQVSCERADAVRVRMRPCTCSREAHANAGTYVPAERFSRRSCSTVALANVTLLLGPALSICCCLAGEVGRGCLPHDTLWSGLQVRVLRQYTAAQWIYDLIHHSITSIHLRFFSARSCLLLAELC